MTINYQQPFYQNPYGPVGYPYQMPPGPMSYPQPAMNPYQEASYVENILRLNKGKVATIYMNFEGSQWGSKIFRGELLAAGKDHIILKDSQSGVNYLLLTIYLSYISFDETIEYSYPFDGV